MPHRIDSTRIPSPEHALRDRGTLSTSIIESEKVSIGVWNGRSKPSQTQLYKFCSGFVVDILCRIAQKGFLQPLY